MSLNNSFDTAQKLPTPIYRSLGTTKTIKVNSKGQPTDLTTPPLPPPPPFAHVSYDDMIEQLRKIGWDLEQCFQRERDLTRKLAEQEAINMMLRTYPPETTTLTAEQRGAQSGRYCTTRGGYKKRHKSSRKSSKRKTKKRRRKGKKSRGIKSRKHRRR